MKEIICENPIQRIWQLLLRFSYLDVINNWWKGHGETEDDELAFFVASSFQQAKSYFDSAINANNNILPLLLYYGSVNLLIGTLSLKKHNKYVISNHGMIINKDSLTTPEIFSIKLKPLCSTGALNIIVTEMEGITDLLSRGQWSLDEILGAIPDLTTEYNFIFPNKDMNVIKVEEVNREGRQLDRISIENEIEGNDIARKIQLLSEYSATYLKPSIPQGHKYLILNRKPESSPIGIYSVSGEKYLPIPFENKGNIFLPQYIFMNMGLFILGTLSRYYPEVWDRFIRYDTSGAKNLINEFFQNVERYFPNLILNIIEGERICFKNG